MFGREGWFSCDPGVGLVLSQENVNDGSGLIFFTRTFVSYHKKFACWSSLVCVFFFAVVVVVVVFFSTCLFDVVLVFGSFLKEILYKKSTNHPWCTIVRGHLSVEDCILCCYSIMLKKCTILIDLILSVT